MRKTDFQMEKYIYIYYSLTTDRALPSCTSLQLPE